MNVKKELIEQGMDEARALSCIRVYNAMMNYCDGQKGASQAQMKHLRGLVPEITDAIAEAMMAEFDCD